MAISLYPIAFVRTPGTTVDDQWGGVISTIELSPEYTEESLLGIEEFSHLEVLFHFHDLPADAVVSTSRHPRNNPQWPRIGIFAQRGAVRPNRIGATIVRLLRRDGTTLHVSLLDAIDGTPVLDIKPVMAEFLPSEPILQPEWSREVMRHYWDAGNPPRR